MKTLIYTGAVLMLGAGIYGFVDYKKKSGDKKFENLYKPATVDIKTEVTPEKETKTPMAEVRSLPEIVPPKSLKKKKNRKLSTKLFSRAALDERVFEKPPVLVAVDSTSSGKN